MYEIRERIWQELVEKYLSEFPNEESDAKEYANENIDAAVLEYMNAISDIWHTEKETKRM